MDTSAVENVVLVVVDALRADRVGCLGSDRGLTPTVDALADESLVFENAFACTNATDPSITSIHTGHYPRETVYHHAHLVTEAEKRRVEACRRLPTLLQHHDIGTLAAGRAMGRWHSAGFDTYPTVESAPGRALKQQLSVGLYELSPRLQRVAATVFHTLDSALESVRPRGEEPADDDGVDELLTAIDARRGPFYGFLHTMDTHAWYDADPELVEELLSTHQYPNRDLASFFRDNAENTVVSKVLEPEATERDYEVGLARLLARYDAAVVEADRKIQRLVDGLRERGNWDETALIICSDHGESLLDHGIYFDHHGLYDESIRVPLVVRTPAGVSETVERFVQLHDLFPTICELFGLAEYPERDGTSVLAHVSHDTEPRDAVFVEEAHAQRRIGVRTRDWKYIEHRDDDTIRAIPNQGDSLRCGYCKTVHGGQRELYDLRSDPTESVDVSEDHPDIVATLSERLTEFEADLSPPTEETQHASVSYEDEEEVLDRLEALGYK